MIFGFRVSEGKNAPGNLLFGAPAKLDPHQRVIMPNADGRTSGVPPRADLWPESGTKRRTRTSTSSAERHAAKRAAAQAIIQAVRTPIFQVDVALNANNLQLFGCGRVTRGFEFPNPSTER